MDSNLLKKLSRSELESLILRFSNDLEDKKHEYEQLLNNMKSGVAIYQAVENGNDFVFVGFNPAAEKMNQTKASEIIGKKVTEVFPAIKKFGLLDVLKKVYQTGKTINHPINLYKDGRIEGWRENLVYKLETGEVVAIHDDITELKEGEKELKESRNFLQAVLDGIPEEIMVINRDFSVALCNKAIRDRLDQAGPLDKMYCYKTHHLRDTPCDGEDHACPLKSVFKNKEPTRVEHRHFNAATHKSDVFEIIAAPICDADGEISQVIEVCRNISERRNAEQALRVSEARYRQIFETNMAIKIIIDPSNGKIVDVNQAAVNFYGYSLDEMKKLKITDINIFSPDEVQREMNRAHQGNRKYFNFKHRLANGEIRDVEVYSGPVETGDKILLYSIINDVTEKRKAEEDNKKLEIQLRQAQKMDALGTLAGGIAHDFNNILGGIIGYTETIQFQAQDNPHIMKFTDNVLKGAERAAGLVRQILTFANRTDEKTSPIQISLIIKEALKLMRATIPKTITINDNISSNAFVDADPTHIHQIIMNLCTNAKLAMHEEGTLKVTLDEMAINDKTKVKNIRGNSKLNKGEYVVLTVSDTGCGIPEETQSRIFDPYFTTRELGKGTGLGLSIVHGIVRKLGGAISLSSEVGRGTEFAIYLPISRDEIYEGSDIPKTDFDFAPAKIMVVDDEELLVEITEHALKNIGHQVEGFTDPLKALEAFKNDPKTYDLIISDITMPKLSGDKLAKEILKKRPEIPIILNTGYNEQFGQEMAIKVGVKAFLMKPIKTRTLITTVYNLLNK